MLVLAGKVFVKVGLHRVNEGFPSGVANSGELGESWVQLGFTAFGSSQRGGVKGAGRVETNRWRGDERPEARGESGKGGWLGLTHQCG